jgi:eukaryotic-like serine/threonine-protein kinase
MGVVYLASSPADDVVALKLVRPELADDEDFRGRFKSEVAVARRVGGVCTAKVRDADYPWVVSDFVAGPNLADLVNRHGSLPPDQQRALALGLAEGVLAIHRAGIVHRDLKPTNVLCSPSGPKVIDFGIAQATDATKVTLAGEVIGSPSWMSPEQVEGGAATFSADVFSLGSVLAFAATGRPPFGKGPLERVMWRILNEPPDLGEEGSVEARLRPLVVGMLEKKRDGAADPPRDT